MATAMRFRHRATRCLSRNLCPALSRDCFEASRWACLGACTAVGLAFALPMHRAQHLRAHAVSACGRSGFKAQWSWSLLLRFRAAERKTWTVDSPHFLGHTISHLMQDLRDGRALLAAVVLRRAAGVLAARRKACSVRTMAVSAAFRWPRSMTARRSMNGWARPRTAGPTAPRYSSVSAISAFPWWCARARHLPEIYAVEVAELA